MGRPRFRLLRVPRQHGTDVVCALEMAIEVAGQNLLSPRSGQQSQADRTAMPILERNVLRTFLILPEQQSGPCKAIGSTVLMERHLLTTREQAR
jgi:hypothetical protein